ncbi:capsular polysaccharide export protein, LipB/KpsS family [Roseimaritima ulvae]|uniref:Capsule polysaccharide biosynthesis protein n=1 Tax=Roseimaritima ulvae TaxID=980254 RepID=A0A5B9R738_9BACT|nr:hypothetical protein [Roseimaritima ulvae]QEG42491.1 hypothetical protein UC8_45300 [Roseimaritima ulvae]
MATILFINCCPHREIEERFWKSVAVALRQTGDQLVMMRYGKVESEIDLIKFPAGFTFSEDPIGVDEEFYKRANQWKRRNLDCKYNEILGQFLELFFVVQPELVIIWNGEQPHDVISKAILAQVGCPVLIAERMPWPGMISIDPSGILSNVSFCPQEPNWHSGQERQFWVNEFQVYEEWLRTEKNTWWQQPSVSTEEELVTSETPPILFAGQVDADTQNFLFSPHFDSNVSAFSWFLDAVDGEEYFVLGKHHPMSDVPATAYCKVTAGRKAQWREDIALDEAFAIAKAVVAVNSSVLCEAIIHRKPALALGDTLLSRSGVIGTIQGKQAYESVRSWLADAKSLGFELPAEQTNRWLEFSAFHFSKNLFALNGTDSLERLRGGKAAASLIHNAVGHKVCWNNIFNRDFRELMCGNFHDVVSACTRLDSPKAKIKALLSRVKRRVRRIF